MAVMQEGKIRSPRLLPVALHSGLYWCGGAFAMLLYGCADRVVRFGGGGLPYHAPIGAAASDNPQYSPLPFQR